MVGLVVAAAPLWPGPRMLAASVAASQVRGRPVPRVGRQGPQAVRAQITPQPTVSPSCRTGPVVVVAEAGQRLAVRVVSVAHTVVVAEAVAVVGRLVGWVVRAVLVRSS